MKDDVNHGHGQTIPNGMLEDNYPRNMWWVAAHRDEVTTKPLARWLLETPVVLYRLEDGTPAALGSHVVKTRIIALRISSVKTGHCRSLCGSMHLTARSCLPATPVPALRLKNLPVARNCWSAN